MPKSTPLEVGAADRQHGVGARRIDRLGLVPASLVDLCDRVGAWAHVREAVGAVGSACGRGDQVAERVEQIDRPALEAGVGAAVVAAVAVEVVIHLAREGHELEVAEVQAGLIAAAGGRERVGSRRGGKVWIQPACSSSCTV